MLKDGQLWIAANETGRICILPDKANRHGLIAGATGTGKTITLKVMAESFSSMGVPSFVADVKGDLAGMIAPGVDSEDMRGRIARFGIDGWAYRAFPTRFWDVFGQSGHSVRTTISEMGPLLLSRVLGLNDVQAGVLTVLFRVADENGLLLLDIKDLKAMLRFLSDNAKALSMEYGNIAPQSVNAIMRAIVALEDQGGDIFFGEPAFNIMDWLATDYSGLGMINILDCVQLFQSPTLYATFLLWLLGELYEALPEAGDLQKPRIVFFFDEAHLLFDDAPKALLQKIEQVVRLVRSKGVGVYFITQHPGDIPDAVLSQLGNRVQHALRAFSPAEQKRVRAAADTFRANPAFKTEDAIMQLSTGEALVSFLLPDGSPAPVERAFILPPQSRMGGITQQEREQSMISDGVGGKYDTLLDRESAYEVLTATAQKAEEARLAQEEAQRLEEEQQALTLQQQQALANQTDLANQTAASRRKVSSKTASAAQRIATSTANSVTRSLISSTVRRPISKKQSVAERAINSAFNTAVTGVGREVTTSIVRGLFGSFKR